VNGTGVICVLPSRLIRMVCYVLLGDAQHACLLAVHHHVQLRAVLLA